jgi:hypothetical protein
VAFAALNTLFIEFVKDETMTLDALKARAATQLRPLARLMEAR